MLQTMAETRKAWAGFLAALIAGAAGYYLKMPPELLVPLDGLVASGVVFAVPNSDKANVGDRIGLITLVIVLLVGAAAVLSGCQQASTLYRVGASYADEKIVQGLEFGRSEKEALNQRRDARLDELQRHMNWARCDQAFATVIGKYGVGSPALDAEIARCAPRDAPLEPPDTGG